MLAPRNPVEVELGKITKGMLGEDLEAVRQRIDALLDQKGMRVIANAFPGGPHGGETWDWAGQLFVGIELNGEGRVASVTIVRSRPEAFLERLRRWLGLQ
jgi:hypothetical protein